MRNIKLYGTARSIGLNTRCYESTLKEPLSSTGCSEVIGQLPGISKSSFIRVLVALSSSRKCYLFSSSHARLLSKALWLWDFKQLVDKQIWTQPQPSFNTTFDPLDDGNHRRPQRTPTLQRTVLYGIMYRETEILETMPRATPHFSSNKRIAWANPRLHWTCSGKSHQEEFAPPDGRCENQSQHLIQIVSKQDEPLDGVVPKPSARYLTPESDPEEKYPGQSLHSTHYLARSVLQLDGIPKMKMLRISSLVLRVAYRRRSEYKMSCGQMSLKMRPEQACKLPQRPNRSKWS